MQILLTNTVKGIKRETKVERMKEKRKEGRGRLECAIKAERGINGFRKV